MDQLDGLPKEKLTEILARIMGLAEEASTAKESPLEDHSEGCHTRQVGCLAESILEIVDWELMHSAVERVTATLNAEKLNPDV